jgi:hypothetical protein
MISCEISFAGFELWGLVTALGSLAKDGFTYSGGSCQALQCLVQGRTVEASACFQSVLLCDIQTTSCSLGTERIIIWGNLDIIKYHVGRAILHCAM